MKSTTLVWELKNECPAIWEKLASELPHVCKQYDTLSGNLPQATSLDPYTEEASIRPLRHLRAFYVKLQQGGVIAIKGTEIVAKGLHEKLFALKQIAVDYPSRGRSLFSVLEHFPIVEQKIPMAVTFNECLEDAESAVLLQSKHIETFHSFAHAPIPLGILKWDEQVQYEFLHSLLHMLSPRAKAIVEMVTQQGLGIILYYYPEVPLRVAHMDLEFKLSKASYPERRTQLAQLTNPKQVIDQWINNVSRMLVLGLMPSSIESIGIGHCLEAQNAVLDGGFVDLGSIKPFSKIQDDKEFLQTLSATAIDLANTIRTFLIGRQVEATAEYRNPTLTMANTIYHVWNELIASLRRFETHHSLDNRLKETIKEQSLFDALNNSYQSLFPTINFMTNHNVPGSSGTSIK